MAAVATAPAGTSPRWIVNRGVDLGLVIGSVFAGYVYLLLYTALHVKISLLWWFWSVGFDGTHIFATASRTYFNAEARARDRNLLYGSLLVFFSLGPLMVLAGQKGLLALLVGIWAYYHVIRQHYGFLVLYKVKNRDLLPVDNRLDRLFLFVMLIFPPFHRFFIHHPEEIGIKLSFARWEPCFWVIVGATAVVWLARQVGRFRARSAQVPAVRRHHSAALADVRVHELAGGGADGDHRAQPAVSRAGVVPQSQSLRGEDGAEPESGGVYRGRAAVQRALPHSGLPARTGVGPGVRFLLRLRTDALLSG